MVNLTRIYTRTGDAGTTRLGDMSETTKNDLRLHAYADVDEANAHLGVALSQGTLEDDVVKVLTHVQNDLFDVGADFCTPVVENPEFAPLRIERTMLTGSKPGATTTTSSCPTFARSSSTAGPRGRPSCTSRAPSSGVPSGRLGRRTPSTPTR